MEPTQPALPFPPTPWERLIQLAGNESRLAAALRVKPQAVQQWAKKGLPPRRVIAAAAVVEFKVTPHELARDLYPHPDDGLPEELRRRDN
jgi:DNA-binding transcriptional regulator YdaS (Cro superfamily)